MDLECVFREDVREKGLGCLDVSTRPDYLKEIWGVVNFFDCEVWVEGFGMGFEGFVVG